LSLARIACCSEQTVSDALQLREQPRMARIKFP
jgi:hypothetical protein